MTFAQDLETRVRTIEEEVRRLGDIEAIKSLKSRYWHYMDSHLRKELEDIFAKDAEIDYGYGLQLKGNKMISRGLRMLTDRKFKLTSHQGHNPRIEIVSDKEARGRWELDQVAIEEGTNAVVRITAYYDDVYVKEEGGWRVKTSKVTHRHWYVEKCEMRGT